MKMNQTMVALQLNNTTGGFLKQMLISNIKSQFIEEGQILAVEKEGRLKTLSARWIYSQGAYEKVSWIGCMQRDLEATRIGIKPLLSQLEAHGARSYQLRIANQSFSNLCRKHEIQFLASSTYSTYLLPKLKFLRFCMMSFLLPLLPNNQRTGTSSEDSGQIDDKKERLIFQHQKSREAMQKIQMGLLKMDDGIVNGENILKLSGTMTSTPSVNTGSQTINTGRLDLDDSPMPELEIFHKRKLKRLLKLYRCQLGSAMQDELLQFKIKKVVKALYGLIKLLEAWYATLIIFLEKALVTRGAQFDKTLFIKETRRNIMLVQVESPFDLEAFSDSDYGGSNLDRKSTTGGCQFLGQRLISWQCKKQTIVATSTTEAEYVAAANCCGQVLWVQNQLLDYGFNFMNTKIHIDNESTICIVKNPVYHSKTKHIEIRHHFIRDCYEKKLISVEKIHTDLNVADLLTKPFDGPRFNYLVVSIGFAEIVDFLRGSNLRYALTSNPTIYDSLVKQFWQTATANTIADGTLEIHATIDTIGYTITEASIRDKLQLADATGITMLPNDEIFEGMGQMGYPTDGTFTFWKSFFTPQWRYLVHHLLHCISSKSGGWDQFGSNIATALICLSTDRVYNFSKLIFDGMVANLKSKTKFLMYPRFLQLILNIQTENKHLYLAVNLTKKIFGNMKRGFRGAPRPLLPAMLLVATTNPNAGQEHHAVPQSQPSSSTLPVPSTSLPPEVDINKKTENQAKMTKLSMEWKRLCKIKAKGVDNRRITLIVIRARANSAGLWIIDWWERTQYCHCCTPPKPVVSTRARYSLDSIPRKICNNILRKYLCCENYDDTSISLPEFESFYVDYPNSGNSTIDVVEDIPVDVPNVLPTHPILEQDFIPTSEFFAYVVWIFLPFLAYPVIPPSLLSCGDEDTIFDPGISKDCPDCEDSQFCHSSRVSHPQLHLGIRYPNLID
ncbi:hypothetical protein Tco_1143485 [Tanacetum coccineum]